MGKRAPSPPPVPDPNELINAQSNANRITQFTPYGNLLFGSVGDQGQFVQGEVPEDGQAAARLEQQRRTRSPTPGMRRSTSAATATSPVASRPEDVGAHVVRLGDINGVAPVCSRFCCPDPLSMAIYSVG